MVDFKELCDEVFYEYKKVYQNIFCRIYPSTGRTGFTERNQTVNFSKAYEYVARYDACATWFEFEFDTTNHYDAIIINNSRKEIILLEAKRLTSITQQIDSVLRDVKRIKDFPSKTLMDSRFSNMLDYKVYGLILMDVWDETNSKREVPDWFKVEKGGFIDKKFGKTSEDGFDELIYYHQDFKNEIFDTDSGCITNKYHLLGFSWRVH